MGAGDGESGEEDLDVDDEWDEEDEEELNEWAEWMEAEADALSQSSQEPGEGWGPGDGEARDAETCWETQAKMVERK
jgi:hypothetical protein